MDAGSVQGVRDREPRREARERSPRPRRSDGHAPSADDPAADAAVIPTETADATDPATPGRPRLDVIA